MKTITYKIKREIKLGHKLDNETRLYVQTKKEVFYIYRKGTIFGFWHNVGDLLISPTIGDPYYIIQSFYSVDQANSYLNCWHNEHYFGKEMNVKLDLGYDTI